MPPGDPTQSAQGSYIVQALDHSNATLNIVERAELTLTEETARRLLQAQLELHLRPAMEDMFTVVSNPAALPFVDSALPYQPAREAVPDLTADLLATLNASGGLLLDGRPGLGKTRELARLAATLCTRGWTVYVCDSPQMKMAVPARLLPGPSRKALLVVDNLHQWTPTAEFPSAAEWLRALLEFFGRAFAPADLRAVVAGRPGSVAPELFAAYHLPEFTADALTEMLLSAAASSSVSLAPADASTMVRESDGTPAMLLENVRAAQLRGAPLTLELWREMRSHDFSERYPLLAARNPDFNPVLSALALLQSANIKPDLPALSRLARSLGAHEIEPAIRDLVENRMISAGPPFRLFDLPQTLAGLAHSGRAVPALHDSWPQIADAVADQPSDLLALAAECARARDLPAAIQLATRAISDPRSESAARLARGIFHLIDRNLPAGRLDLEASQTPDPQRLFWLALADLSTGDAGSAEPRLTALIEAGLRNADAFLARALARIRLANPAAAEADLDAAIAAGPLDPAALLLRGCLRLRRDPAAAEADLDSAIALGQHDPVAYLARAALRTARGDQSGAETDFTAALHSGDPHPEIFFSRGVARLLQRQWQAAEQDFNRALASLTRHPDPWALRAAARSAQNNFAGAVADLTQALECAAPSPELLRARSIARYKAGDFAGANRDRQEAARLRRRSGGSWWTRFFTP